MLDTGPANGNSIYSDQGPQFIRIANNLFEHHCNAAILFAEWTSPQNRLTIVRNRSIDDRTFLFLWSSTDVLVARNKRSSLAVLAPGDDPSRRGRRGGRPLRRFQGPARPAKRLA